MVIPRAFAIHVTYACPLACAHCAHSSSPKNRDRLPLNHLLETIRSLDVSTIRMVTFTGGEPFLCGQDLVSAVSESSRRGFITRVVTSAYFAVDSSTAHGRLSALSNSGLHELIISWDDYHAEFISFACIHNAYWAAKDLGLRVAIHLVQSNDSYWTAAKVHHELGGDVSSQHIIIDSPLHKTGRAASKLRYGGLPPKRILGPCPYILTAPALSAKNKLLACCGVIPETEALVMDPNLEPQKLQAVIEKGQQSLLWKWLFLRGPYAIMEWLSKRYRLPIIDRENVGGNCEACHLLFSNHKLASKIPAALTENPDEIVDELHLLKNLEILTPETILSLWQDSSPLADLVLVSKP